MTKIKTPKWIRQKEENLDYSINCGRCIACTKGHMEWKCTSCESKEFREKGQAYVYECKNGHINTLPINIIKDIDLHQTTVRLRAGKANIGDEKR